MTSDPAGSGVYAPARRADGTSRLVGRYRVSGAPGTPRAGEFVYVGSWLRNEDGDDCVGCLACSPSPAPPDAVAESAGVAVLAEIADGFEKLLRGEAAPVLIERLFRAGHSLGSTTPRSDGSNPPSPAWTDRHASRRGSSCSASVAQ